MALLYVGRAACRQARAPSVDRTAEHRTTVSFGHVDFVTTNAFATKHGLQEDEP
jgi:hypothetical protein